MIKIAKQADSLLLVVRLAEVVPVVLVPEQVTTSRPESRLESRLELIAGEADRFAWIQGQENYKIPA